MQRGRRRFGWRLAMPIVAGWVAINWGAAAQAQNTQRGAVLGGLGGAIAGAVIGDHNRNAGAGAAIGGAIGAVGGAVLGNARDQEINQQRQYQYQAQQHQVYVLLGPIVLTDGLQKRLPV
jgi:outer membrane lipoprotein SlyB